MVPLSPVLQMPVGSKVDESHFSLFFNHVFYFIAGFFLKATSCERINFNHQSFIVCCVCHYLETKLGLSFSRDNNNVRESNWFFKFAKESFLMLFVLCHCHIPMDKVQVAAFVLFSVITILEHFYCFVETFFYTAWFHRLIVHENNNPIALASKVWLISVKVKNLVLNLS